MTVAAQLAEALLQQGFVDDVGAHLDEAGQADDDDLSAQASLRRARARYYLATGDPQAARRWAEDAVRFLERAQSPLDQGESYIVLAEALAADRQAAAADDALDRARAVLDQKGASAAVERVDRLRQQLASE